MTFQGAVKWDVGNGMGLWWGWGMKVGVGWE